MEPWCKRVRTYAHPNSRYGGLVIAQCITAGSQTVSEDTDPPFQLYSVQGTFLGPASTDAPTTFEVSDVRTTRTFCSRLVKAIQTIDGEVRNIMIVIMDWHLQEAMTLFDYSTPPLHPLESYSRPDDLPDIRQLLESKLPAKLVNQYLKAFHLHHAFFDNRMVMSSMGAQNIGGFIGPGTVTTQDDLPMTKRTHSSWSKVKEALKGRVENIAALA